MFCKEKKTEHGLGKSHRFYNKSYFPKMPDKSRGLMARYQRSVAEYLSGVQNLRTGGSWFDHRLGNFLSEIMLRREPLSSRRCPLFYYGYLGKQSVAWKEYCADYWWQKLQESMDR